MLLFHVRPVVKSGWFEVVSRIRHFVADCVAESGTASRLDH